MDNLFERANTVALSHVPVWLPDGRQEGEEWVALNPTRPDHNLGSFRVNLRTGKWADFAVPGASGPDAVSLYVYLNQHIYSSTDGKAQYKAACDLLGIEPSRTPSPPPTNKWAGWTRLKTLQDPPELRLYKSDSWGEPVAKWFFLDDGAVAFAVVRYLLGGKKTDIAYTLWTDGQRILWRAKHPEKPYILYNKDFIAVYPDKPILLVEGQKAAHLLQEVIGDVYNVVGWYGGSKSIKNQDWSPLKNRQVVYAHDNDAAGRATVPELAHIIDNLLIVPPPPEAPQGWDLADVIKEWGKEKILEYIRDTAHKIQQNNTHMSDTEAMYKFDVVGYDGNTITFYNPRCQSIITKTAGSMTKTFLMTLQSKQDWAEMYPAKTPGSVRWDDAISDLITIAETKKPVDLLNIRGAGAWDDRGDLVLNTGTELIIKNKKVDMSQYRRKYIYCRSAASMPFCAAPALSTKDAAELINVLRLIKWSKPSSAYLLAGWLVLAPYAGALSWRPHVWLAGPRGSGKSWILDNIVLPIIEEFAVAAKGSTTPAGIRQALQGTGRAIILDEMEADSRQQADNIEKIVHLMREASSGHTAGTLHGSADGTGRAWVIQSMALFASIGANITQGADTSRYSLIELEPPARQMEAERRETFLALKHAVKSVIVGDYGLRLAARTYQIWPELRKSIDIFVEAAMTIYKSRRLADQIGTLLAGAYMLERDAAPLSIELAEAYITGTVGQVLDELDTDATSDSADAHALLDALMEAVIQTGPYEDRSVAQLVWECRTYEDGTGQASQHLQMRGLKVADGMLYIATAHTGVTELLRNNPWREKYVNILKTHPRCVGVGGPGRFAGVQKRYLKIKLEDDGGVMDTSAAGD